MKRNVENAFGSARSAFQPVSQRSRVDMPSYPSALLPEIGMGQPVMRSLAPRIPVQMVWQNFLNNGTKTSSPVQEEHPSFDPKLIAGKAEALRAAILNGSSEEISDLLSGQDASDIALTTDDRGRNALFHAIEKNDLLTMDRLFSLSSCSKLVMQRHHSGAFPLTFAAEKGSALAVIQILNINVANKQVYPDESQFNPLLVAARRGHEAVVKILLDSPYGAELAKGKNREGFDALNFAAWNGHAGVVSALLASVHAAELIQNNTGAKDGALATAVYKGRETVAAILLASPYADLLLQSRHGFNVLMIAAQNGHEGTVKLLLASNFAEALVKQKNDEGLNALMLAAFKGHRNVVRVLLEFGFVQEQLDGTYCGHDIIHNAGKLGFSEVSEILHRYQNAAKQSKTGGQWIMPTTAGQ